MKVLVEHVNCYTLPSCTVRIWTQRKVMDVEDVRKVVGGACSWKNAAKKLLRASKANAVEVTSGGQGWVAYRNWP